ncbi:MAG: hypothetical protein LBH76_00325, partial [Propionibacteriaceae bacterium]|nr:hypothetical protein [Propionibacteriaceae bacterium]
RDYSFTFSYQGGGWRVYIDNSPNYGRRPSGSVETHRLGLGARPYICWTTALPTISAAQGVAALWADATERYIATGRFEPPPNRPRVQDHSVLGDLAPAAQGARGAFVAPAARPVAAHPVAARGAWYEDGDFRLWGGALIGMTLFGLIWVVGLRDGFGFWDCFWMAGALAGAVVAVVKTEFRPGGRGWPIAYAVSGAVLGFCSLAGHTPGLFWLTTILLFLANGAQYALAASRR